MENYQIENQDLLLAFSEKGAELIRIYDKKGNVMCSGTPILHSGHATLRFFSPMWEGITEMPIRWMGTPIHPNSTVLPGTLSLRW